MIKAKLTEIFHTHRFFIGTFLFVFSLGFYADLKPLGEQFYDLLAMEQRLIFQVGEKEKAFQQIGVLSAQFIPVRNKKNLPLLDQIAHLTLLNHFNLSSIEIEPREGDHKNDQDQQNVFLIKISLNGLFGDFFHFLEGLNDQELPLLLNHFTLKMQEEQLDISMQFTAFPLTFWVSEKDHPLSSKESISCCDRDPFHEALDSVAKLGALTDRDNQSG